jgi:hypothetical protein
LNRYWPTIRLSIWLVEESPRRAKATTMKMTVSTSWLLAVDADPRDWTADAG